MKRKSARPVVVEVKRTRASPSSIANVFGRNSSDKNLWRGVSLQPEAQVSSRSEPTRPLSPVPKIEPEVRLVRRVLPSLLPMVVPSQPENQETVTKTIQATWTGRAAQTTRVPRTVPEVVRPAAEPSVPDALQHVAQDVVELPVPSPHSTLSPSPIRERSEHRGREIRHPELRRGERWKRRLPRSCW